MKPEVQHKINALVALSKLNSTKAPFAKFIVQLSNDSLSQAIRTKRDAELFKNELKVAIHLSQHKTS